MKLRKVSKVFHQQDAAPLSTMSADRSRQNDLHYTDILANMMPDIFPNEHEIQMMLRRLEYQDQATRPNKIYTAEYLPFHIRDNKWLTQYVHEVVSQKRLRCIIGLKDIQDYVENSGVFYSSRDQYEENLIKAQIQYMLTKPVPNGLMVSQRAPYQHHYMADYDKFFRKQLVKALSQTGINKYKIEAGIERNAHLWRQQVMTQTFENLYYPHPYPELIEKHQEFDTWWGRLAQMKKEHQAAWLKYRELDYYAQHKAIIDRTGTATENMKMTGSDASQLLNEVKQYNTIHSQFFNDNNQLTDSVANLHPNQDGRSLL